MALVTITPAMQQVILIGIQLAMMKIEKDTKGMTQKDLIQLMIFLMAEHMHNIFTRLAV